MQRVRPILLLTIIPLTLEPHEFSSDNLTDAASDIKLNGVSKIKTTHLLRGINYFMPITMKDIAAAAATSRATVSLVLNGRSSDLRIAETTRLRVLEAARRLGYRRNELARAVKRGRSNVIAFIGGSGGSYVMDIITGINAGLQEQGFLLKMFLLERHTDFADVTGQCLEQMVAGVICRSLSSEALEQLRLDLVPAGIPVIQVDNSFSREWCGRVVSDDVAGGRLAVEHLLALGHRRIGLLTIADHTGYAVLRRQGYREALTAAGLSGEQNPELAIPQSTEWTGELQQKLTGYLREQRPTAVFCVTDPLAMKMLLAAHRSGRQVPGNLSVIGYAGLDYTGFSTPPLTTIAQPFAAMGKTAAEHLLTAVNRDTPAPLPDLKLPVRLVLRQSTAIPYYQP